MWADLLREGHDRLAAALLWRKESDDEWRREPMALHNNDRWHGAFTPPEPGRYLFCIEAWTDHYASWLRGIKLKLDAGLDVSLEAREGRELLDELKLDDPQARQVVNRAKREFDAVRKRNAAPLGRACGGRGGEPRPLRPDPRHSGAGGRRPPAGALRRLVRDDPAQPGHGAGQARHVRRLHRAAAGDRGAGLRRRLSHADPSDRHERTARGATTHCKAEPGDPGSPYAIGSAEGGHTAVHPELGTLADFRRFVEACKSHGMEVALDFAIQCSPDHPWLTEHPEWFKRRPDGSIQYAENPPKKYEDIVNPDFYCADRIALWQALRDVVLFWVRQGVKIFRVDNPHTKPFPFWEWLIHEVQSRRPERAVPRRGVHPAEDHEGRSAKLGFTQSYTYFTWRTTKAEFQDYLTEITRYPERDYFRPNFFTNTPDILPIHLQSGEPWMFKSRVALAATLSSTYGIYNGYELLEHEPIPGTRGVLDSEKYEIKVRDWNKPGNIKDYIGRLNRIRRENRALQQTSDLRFAQVDDAEVIGFVKESVDARQRGRGCDRADRRAPQLLVPLRRSR